MADKKALPFFLGFDLSTQQIKAVVISDNCQVVHASAVRFDEDLPHYRTTNGAIYGPADNEVTAPVAMWLEALDVLMDRLKHTGLEFGMVVALSGAAQQHGSVYWSGEAELLLSSLDENQSLSGQLFPKAFIRHNAPIWQDSSTRNECLYLEESVGGPQALADLTGSKAYERFTGPQIIKLWRENPKAYEATARISLVSSFLCSLFLGKIAPIERSDASGMNLMNISLCKWDDRLLEACGGPGLRSKLGPEPVFAGQALGIVSEWWVKRWGFNPGCIVTPFTGDNPATIVSLSAPGDAILSLGTSTTLLLSIPASDKPPKRFTTSHLLAHPKYHDAYIAMLCYKNGALAREKVRDIYAGGDWNTFNQFVEATPPGNNGYFGLYYPLPEIIPANVTGEFLFSCQDSGSPVPVDMFLSIAHPRAVLESQLFSILSRIKDILFDSSRVLRRLVVSGGSSTNKTILQMAADVLAMPVYTAFGPMSTEAACLGGAKLARFGWKEHNCQRTTQPVASFPIQEDGLHCVAEPREVNTVQYQALLKIYRACEDEALRRSNAGHTHWDFKVQ